MGGRRRRPHPGAMDTTTNHTGTTNRTGAVWVAGTGAFLLLAATALFVAVRWDDLPGAAKLGIVGALTGAFLLGGRALARTLPATGDVIFHLGALLIPVDVAAVSVRLGLGWRGLLLAEGLAAGGALAALAATTGSVVLTGVAATAPVAVAAGLAAVSPLPAPLLLALAAVAASAAAPIAQRAATRGARAEAGAGGGRARPDRGVVPARLGVAWAALAGLAPVLGTVAVAVLHAGQRMGTGVLTELGLAGHSAGWAALASGALAAAVIGREAKARGDGGLAGLAVAVFLAGAGPAGVAADLTGRSALLALPGLFVAVEAAALLARRDEFWGRIVAGTALLAEVPAAVIGWPVAVFWTLVCPITNDLELFGERFQPDRALGVSLGLLALGWFLMGARHRFAGAEPDAGRPGAGSGADLLRAARDAAAAFAWLLVPAAVGAVAVGTASGPATAAAIVVLGALLATAPCPPARLVAGALALWAPISTFQRPWTALAAGLAGAAVATLAARQAGRRDNTTGAPVAGGADRRTTATGASAAAAAERRPWPVFEGLTRAAAELRVEEVLLTTAAIGAVLLGWFTGPSGDGLIVASLLAVAACTAVSAALEPAPVLPMLARAGAVLAACGAAAADPHRALPALLAATALSIADAIGRDRPEIGFGAAATAQLVVFDLARRGGLDAAGAGLALCVAAVVWAGLALLTDDRWRPPLLAAAAVGIVGGVVLASRDPRSGADALLIAGGLVAAAGLVTRRPAAVGAGAVIASLAVGSHLEISHVRATDAYLAPVAALLLGAGFHLRRSGAEAPSSWVAYTPAVALLGGSALVERIAGGGGVHALVAGAVGIAAVAAGGARRLAGPLVAGTALLVAVTVHESLATLATVPTWGWLAAGGTLLLAVGVGLERRGGSSPAEAGRRLVDVVAERFS